jgi:O-antigen ligase
MVGVWGWTYLLTHRVHFRKYYLHILYLAACYLSLANASDVPYVLFQVLSLTVVLVFSFAFYEANDTSVANIVVFRTVFYSYLIIMLVSLVVSKLSNSTAYEVLWGGETRFRGVFPKSAMLASSAGVLIILSLYMKAPFVAKSLAILSGGACIIMTQSRTFWIALIASVLATEFIYRRGNQKKLFLGGCVCLIVLGIVYALDIHLKSDSAKNFIRIDTVSNLTGRVSLWKEALAAFDRHPYIGVGLTAGSTTLGNQISYKRHTGDLESGRAAGRATMHNGYIQSLLDLGALGSFFYLIIVLLPIVSLFRKDMERVFRIEFCTVCYFAVANFAENVIYAVTVFNSCLFFMISVHAVKVARPIRGSSIKNIRLRNKRNALPVKQLM